MKLIQFVRRGSVKILCGLGFFLVLGVAQAADYPTKTVRLIVPYAPGGTTDIVARLYAKNLAAELGQNVIVENKPGGATNIGSEYVAHSPSDGYTVLFGSKSYITAPLFGPYPSVDYSKALVPVSFVSDQAFVIATAERSGIKNAAELIDRVRESPGDVTLASAQLDLYIGLTSAITGLDFLHVPYKGGGPSLLAVLSGEVDVGYTLVPAAIGYFRDDQMRPLVVTSRGRQPSIPDTPSFAEITGKDLDLTAWYGVFVPEGTPKNVVDRLSDATRKAMDTEEMRGRLSDMGAVAKASTPEEFQSAIEVEREEWLDLLEKRPDLAKPR